MSNIKYLIKKVFILTLCSCFISATMSTTALAEVIAMHQQLNNLPAGQGALGAVVLILVIFILLDVAGVTDIFPGV